MTVAVTPAQDGKCSAVRLDTQALSLSTSPWDSITINQNEPSWIEPLQPDTLIQRA